MTARDVLKAYESLINRHDFSVLAGLIADDASFWFSDGPHHGLVEIRSAFEHTWQRLGDETYWLDDLVWIAEGETAAACTYRFNWESTLAGQKHTGSGRGTTVFRKTKKGWQIVHEHLSRFPPTRPA